MYKYRYTYIRKTMIMHFFQFVIALKNCDRFTFSFWLKSFANIIWKTSCNIRYTIYFFCLPSNPNWSSSELFWFSFVSRPFVCKSVIFLKFHQSFSPKPFSLFQPNFSQNILERRWFMFVQKGYNLFQMAIINKKYIAKINW